MADLKFNNEYLDKYVSEFTSRIVAESGIPSDRYHLGKIILQGLKDDPNFVLQIDGGTDESETNKSVLQRSIQCATSLKNLGLKTGDVMILMAPNHLDLAIPFYAALYLGIAIAPIDRTLGVHELKGSFDIDKPKIIFCQSEKVQDVQKALDLIGLDAKIVSFDKSEYTLSFSEMLEKYSEKIEAEDFRATDFDAEETIALLVTTSGTTGLPKSVILTHKNSAVASPHIWKPHCWGKKFPLIQLKIPNTEAVFIVSPLQWLTAIVSFINAPYLKYTRIQSSKTHTAEHLIDIINKYKPTFMILSPTLMTTMLKTAEKVKCNFSSFEYIFVAGSAVHKDLVTELKRLTPNTYVTDMFGMSELGSTPFYCLGSPLGSCGKRFSHMEYKLVNTETGNEITESHKGGELWLKGPIFKGYYNNPEETRKVFSEDGWFKTGDMMYRDENWNFYYVERIKMLLKYRNHQISPIELEAVIRQHPSVLDVAVVGIPDLECGDLPVACVVKRPGTEVSSEEIKDLVKQNLTDTKQLRGGVIFLEELPVLPSSKVNRQKLKEIVLAYTNSRSHIKSPII